MSRRLLVAVPILAIISYGAGFLLSPVKPDAASSATPTPAPTPDRQQVTDCYSFTIPAGYESPNGDAAKCELVTKLDGKVYISISRQSETDTADYTDFAVVRKKTTQPNCGVPAVTAPEHGLTKSVFRCVGQTNQYYYFAAKGSRLGNLPGLSGKSLFFYVVDSGTDPQLHGDQLLAQLKPND